MNKVIIKGIILLLTIILLVLVGWTINESLVKKKIIEEKEKEKIKVIEIQEQKIEIQEQREEQLLTKENPPFEIGDVVGYSEEGLPEKYVGKVVLKAEWGFEVGQVGGIQAIEVDNNENIYILEILPDDKNRVQKFNKNRCILSMNYGWISGAGNADGIYVDKDSEEIYLYESISIYKGLIKHYSPSGNLIAIYQAPEDAKLGNGIYIKNGTLYSKLDGKKIYDIKEMKSIKREKKGDKVYLHGIDISLKDPEKSVNVVKVNLKPLKQKGVIEKFYKDEIVLEFPDPTRDFYFKGIDEEGNIYFLCKLVYPERVHSPEYEMTKYDLTGKLLTVIKMRDGLELKGHWIPYLTMIVDSNGNIYDIFGSEENVYVIKWLKE